MSARRRWLTILLPVALLLVGGLAALQPLLRAADLRAELLQPPIILGVLSVAAAIALASGRRIGWLLALSIVGWNLAGSLALWWAGEPEHLSMALVAASAVLLTSPDLRAAYEETEP